MKKCRLLGVVLFVGMNSILVAKEISYTLEDRDRLIRVETTLEEFKESVDKRFDQLTDILIGIVAAFAGIVAVTIGFAIWDRRTALAPYLKRHRELEERSEILVLALKEYAKAEPKLAEILKSLGILL